MELSRILRQKGSRPARELVADALDRELEDRPGRTYGDVIDRLAPGDRVHRDDGGAQGDASDLADDDVDTDDDVDDDDRERVARRTKGGDDEGAARAAGGDRAEKKTKKKKKEHRLPIRLKVTPARSVSGGLNPGGDAFGLMEPSFSFTGFSHKVGRRAIELTATMQCDYRWGVHGLGNVDVPSGSAGFITAANYKAVADDIDPDKGSHTNAAVYDTYWSQAATEAHELEHVRDDWEDFVPDKGVKTAQKAFKGKKVRPSEIDAKLPDLARRASRKVFAASDKHYGVPKSYYSRPGEIKAHAVGAAVERPLAAAVRQHGKALADAEAAAAKSGGESAPASAPAEGSGGRGRRDAQRDRAVDRVLSLFH